MAARRYSSAIPTEASIAAFLQRVREAVRVGAVRLTDYARERASEELGWDFFDICEELRELTIEDFHRCEPSMDRPWENVWTFTPPLVDDGYLWVRLTERDGVLVVSFHRG